MCPFTGACRVFCPLIALAEGEDYIFGESWYESVPEAASSGAAGKAGASPNREVKAGIFYFDGYHMMDKDGKYSGYGIDLLNLISKHSHLNFHFTGHGNSWDDILKMLKSGEIDVVTLASRTPDKEADFAFSLPVGRKQTVLTARASDSSLKTGDRKSYDGIIVGALAGDSQQK